MVEDLHSIHSVLLAAYSLSPLIGLLLTKWQIGPMQVLFKAPVIVSACQIVAKDGNPEPELLEFHRSVAMCISGLHDQNCVHIPFQILTMLEFLVS